MALRLAAVAAALAVAWSLSGPAGAAASSAAAAATGGKPAKPAAARCGRAARRARCAVVRRPKRRAAAGAPLERLLGVGPGPLLAPAPAPAPGEHEGPAPEAPALPRFVSVAAREFSLTLSRPLVGAGAVTVELRNSGADPHNLVVSPDGSRTPLASFSELDPGTYERRAVTLTPGRYQLWCSLEFHEGLGMSATLRVE
jgi:hypothetical protein